MNTHLLHAQRYLSYGLLLTLLLAWQSVHAEDFRVLSFRSDITLKADGSFEVVEDILLDFSQPRHGFIRVLPYRYQSLRNISGEIAAGHVANTYYVTPIRDILVEGIPFVVDKRSNDIEIKIGSADTYVTGRQHYRLHYKVYGAINFFAKHAELSWNVNGNDWEAEFDTLAATIHLPSKKVMAAADVKAATGKLGMRFNQTRQTILPGLVQFEGTSAFAAHEGMTVSLRFPKGYLSDQALDAKTLAEAYYVDQLKSVVKVHENGVIDVEALASLELLVANAEIRLKLPNQVGETAVDGAAIGTPAYDILACEIMDAASKWTVKARLGPQFKGNATRELILDAGSFPKKGRYTMRLVYRVWGAAWAEGKGTTFVPPLILNQPDAPILNHQAALGWDISQPLMAQDWRVLASSPPGFVASLGDSSLDVRIPVGTSHFEPLQVALHWPDLKPHFALAPQHVSSAAFYYPSYHVDLELQPDGWIKVVNRFALQSTLDRFTLQRPIMLVRQQYRWDEGNFSRPNFWGRQGYYLFDNLETEGKWVPYGSKRSHTLEFSLRPGGENTVLDTFSYSYEIAGCYHDSAGLRWLSMPLVEVLDAATDIVSASIRLPAGRIDPDAVHFISSYEEFYSGEPLRCKPEVEVVNGSVRMRLPCGMPSEMKMRLLMGLPQDMIRPSLRVNFRLLWKNHRAVFYPLFFFIPLFLLWFFLGRDKRFTKVVEFYPPEDITPAEAGLLIDEKLNNRDLLSLIYYWGAQGIVEMREVNGAEGTVTDYSLTKLKSLPKGARKYEKIMFEALFATENPTKISAHNQKFYITMGMVRAAFDEHVKRKNFYMPGSLGWAKALGYLGWIFVLVTALSLAMVWGGFSNYFVDRYEIPAAWGLISATFLFFAHFMPKFGSFGLQQYQKLIGFQEFVMRAEKDKLKELVNTNPDYFGMTLPYAIAMGIASQWVDRFEGLTVGAPHYYHVGDTRRRDHLDEQQFVLMLNKQLDQMASSFNSAPVSTSSGGRSYSSRSSSYSSGSSSYSSSSSSGGSSFSSGGGSSGSGYGGGGGRSW